MRKCRKWPAAFCCWFGLYKALCLCSEIAYKDSSVSLFYDQESILDVHIFPLYLHRKCVHVVVPLCVCYLLLSLPLGVVIGCRELLQLSTLRMIRFRVVSLYLKSPSFVGYQSAIKTGSWTFVTVATKDHLTVSLLTQTWHWPPSIVMRLQVTESFHTMTVKCVTSLSDWVSVTCVCRYV